VASSRVSVGDVVTTMVFVAFTAGSPLCDAFYMRGEVIGGTADYKGCTVFVDAAGDGCQGDGLRSLTCVTFRAGRKIG